MNEAQEPLGYYDSAPPPLPAKEDSTTITTREMSHTSSSRRNYSPSNWRAGGNDESSITSKTWVSQETPDSMAHRDGGGGGGAERYVAGEIKLSEIPIRKHLKFDDLVDSCRDGDGMGSKREGKAGVSDDVLPTKNVKYDDVLERFESNCEEMTTASFSEDGSRADEDGGGNASVVSSKDRYAIRARELRMSLDAPPRKVSPERAEGRDRQKTRKSLHNVPSAKPMPPHPTRPEERARDRQKLRKSIDGVTGRSGGRERARESRKSHEGAAARSEGRERAQELRMSLEGNRVRSKSLSRREHQERASRQELRMSLDDGRARSKSSPRREQEEKAQRRELKVSLDSDRARSKSLSRTEHKEIAPRQELRMSLDDDRARSKSLSRTEHKDRAHRQKSRSSYDSMPKDLPPTPSRSASRSARKDPSQRARHTPLRQSAAKNLSRSSSEPVAPASLNPPPIRPPSPNQEDFRMQVEQFHSSLVLAHGTIANLENDVQSLKICISALEERNLLLEETNQSLNENLVKKQNEMNYIQGETATIFQDKSKFDAIFIQQIEEIKKLKSECNRYKTYQREMAKSSTDRDGVFEDTQREKQNLEDIIQEKDETIDKLQSEIQQLSQEVADGAIARSNMSNVQETVKRLEAELKTSKEKQTPKDRPNMRVVVDLNEANMTITRME